MKLIFIPTNASISSVFWECKQHTPNVYSEKKKRNLRFFPANIPLLVSYFHSQKTDIMLCACCNKYNSSSTIWSHEHWL